MTKNRRSGFTLGELLIVVAIIGVLVAVSVPIFSHQLEKARDATTLANFRNAYSEAMTEYLSPDSIDRHKTGNAYPSGWVGSGYHLWLNYYAGQINAIDVVIRIENTKTSYELSQMLAKSNLPFKVHVSGSRFPSGLYLIQFSFQNGTFGGSATLSSKIIGAWKKLDLSA
ncbi:MAG TPA: hypothetical protein DGX96_03545 [Lachnospiraceae bacterium]|nr:hypothetical protein [Lachnospiraceae bacterium]